MLQLVLHQVVHARLRQADRLANDADALAAVAAGRGHLVAVDTRLAKLLAAYVASLLLERHRIRTCAILTWPVMSLRLPKVYNSVVR